MRKLTILAKQSLIGERYKETEIEIDKHTGRQYRDTLFSSQLLNPGAYDKKLSAVLIMLPLLTVILQTLFAFL
jgi:hypothetical protein